MPRPGALAELTGIKESARPSWRALQQRPRIRDMQQVMISKPATAPRRSRWQVFTGEPHRVMFFAGMVQGVIAACWWLVDLLGRYAGGYAPIPWTVPAPWAHAFLMIYGFLPFFMFGFLMTAVPNWLKVAVPRAYYLPAMLSMSAGCLLFYPGLLASREVVTAALLLVLAGWGIGLAGLFRLIVLTPERDVRHASILFTAMACGWIGLACLIAALYVGSPLLPLIVPRRWHLVLRTADLREHQQPDGPVLFRSCAAGPGGLPGLDGRIRCCSSAAAGHGVLTVAGLAEWTWLVDLPMCVAVGHLALDWGLLRSFKVHLLAVLHLSLVALTVSLALFAIQSFALFATGDYVLGRAPLHAMTIGYFSAMVIGMVSRVSLGHSGRMLMADRLTWLCYLGMLGAALLRVGAELPGVPTAAGHALSLASACRLARVLHSVGVALPAAVRVAADRPAVGLKRGSGMDDFALARVLHVLAVVLWIGGVAMVTTVLLPAVGNMKTPRERVEFFERVERRFAWQARVTTLIAGVSGFYMVHYIDAWNRFAQAAFWWMHAMVIVWVLFTVMLFILEPLVLHRYFLVRAERDPVGTFALIQRMHWVLLTISLLAVAGAVAGSHGWFWV